MQSVLAYSNCSIRLGIMIIILESLINVAVLCCDALAHFFFFYLTNSKISALVLHLQKSLPLPSQPEGVSSFSRCAFP